MGRARTYCEVSGCHNVTAAWGACSKHYRRRLAHAALNKTKNVVHASTCECGPCRAVKNRLDRIARREELAGRYLGPEMAAVPERWMAPLKESA
jgi:hypothetical protein